MELNTANLQGMIDIYGGDCIVVLSPSGDIVDGFNSRGMKPHQIRDAAWDIAAGHAGFAVFLQRHFDFYSAAFAVAELTRLEAMVGE
jgi:hypothetical protein